MCLLVAPLVLHPALAETVRRIDKLRPLRINTPVVRDGKATAIVACPPEREHQLLADRLIAHVKRLTGAELPLVDDDKVSDEDLRRSEIIVIGNFLTNAVAEKLYIRKWTWEDYVYPGIGGESAGFEELTQPGDVPPVWTFSSGDVSTHSARVDDASAHTGKRCVKLLGRRDGDGAWAAVSRVISSPTDTHFNAGQEYVASVWCRSDGDGSGQLKVTSLRGGEPVGTVSAPIKPTLEWVQASTQFVMPKGADQLALELRLEGGGVLWVDDVSIARKGSDRNLLALSGYVVRTVHDPFAKGHNFIVLAGSDLQGTAEAVERFTASLEGAETLVVPHTLDVRLGTKQRMLPSYGRADPTQATIDQLIGQLQRTVFYLPSLHNNVWYQTLSWAEGYHLTGNPGWAQVYKAQMELLVENLDRFADRPNNYIEGMHRLVPAWDMMEETPFFTNEERLKFTNAVLEVACRNAKAWQPYLKNPRREALSSHGGERVQSLRLAGRYFRDHYGIHGDWVTMTDEAIRFMDETPRSCDGYRVGCGHGSRLTQYARRSGDMAYIETDSLRHQADLVMTCTDNSGNLVSLGDQDNWEAKIDREWNLARMMGEAAWFYGDPGYLWFTQYLPYAHRPFGAFATPEPPPTPDRFVGLHVLPLHPNLYVNMTLDERQTVRTCEPAPTPTVLPDEAFDKISFREGVAPDQEYLLLDGVSGMDHGHIDGNAISRFADLERIWLIDCGWTRVYPRDHNMLLVSRDGESRAPQKVTRLDLAADLTTMAFTKTTTRDYNGVDWSRHLFWVKGEYFVVLDHVQAKIPGDYALRCRWRALGEGHLREEGLQTTQHGRRFSIVAADGSRKRLRQVPPDDTVNSILSYPHHNRQHEVLVYDNVHEMELAPRDAYTFMNVLRATSGAPLDKATVRRVGRSAVSVSTDDGKYTFGIAEKCPMFAVGASTLCLAGATALGEPPVLGASTPLDIEYDFDTGKGVLATDGPTTFSLPASAAIGEINGEAVTGELTEGVLTVNVPAGRHSLSLAPSREGARRLRRFVARLDAASADSENDRPARAGGLDIVWEHELPDDALVPGDPDPMRGANEVAQMVLADLTNDDESEIVLATRDGAVTVLDLSGKKLWRRTGLDRSHSVAVARLKSGPHVVVATEARPYLFVFDAKGQRVTAGWLQPNPTMDERRGIVAPVRWLEANDMNGDGSDEILAATSWKQDSKKGQVRGRYYCYDGAGKLLWQKMPVHHELGAATIAPLKPGAKPLWFVGGTFGSCAGLDASGAERFRCGASHRPTVIRVADLDGDGANEVLLGGEDNYVHLHSADGTRRWMHNVGGSVSGIEVTDLDGDGTREIVVSTRELGYNVFALDAEGSRLWQAKAGEEVNALAVGDIDGRRGNEVVVGTDGGEVLVFGGSGDVIARAAVQGYVSSLALCARRSPGGRDVIAALKSGRVLRLTVPPP